MATEVNDGERRYLRIGELGRRSGISPETIRAWERRYGLLTPGRTGGGFRLYSDDDLARVRAMRAHLEAGIAAAEAARLVADAARRVASERVAGTGGELEVEVAALAAAIARFDAADANAALDRLLAAFSLDAVLDAVLVPYLHELGDRWERGEASVGEEHYATNVIRSRLIGLARGWDRGLGPRAVLACAPGEQHDLGLLCFGLALRERGWRIEYLGADTPVATVAEVAHSVSPRAVVVAAELDGLLEPVLDELVALARDVTLGIGGRATSPALAASIGAIALEGAPAAAAEQLARAHA
jgi:DNA-binding transcriptional MerR regulator